MQAQSKTEWATELRTAITFDEVIFLLERQKDVDALRNIKLVATCDPERAGNEFTESLRNADVVIICGSNQAGRDHAEQVAGALHGIAKCVRVLDLGKVWPACPQGGGISDWIEGGGTAKQLSAIVKQLPYWQPSVGEKRGRPLTAAELLSLELPQRETILAPWLPEKGLAMVYSPRGVGKTLLGLSSAYAIAVGAGFLGFKGPARARKVLYIDGEMPAQTMQERLAAIVGGFTKQPPADDYFRILISDLHEFGLPDLATLEGQAWINARVGDAEVLLIDNISTLFRSGKENEAEGWLPAQSWALGHRRAGRTMVFFHHAGKEAHSVEPLAVRMFSTP